MSEAPDLEEDLYSNLLWFWPDHPVPPKMENNFELKDIHVWMNEQ